MDGKVILPPGVRLHETTGSAAEGRGVIVNESDLPDRLVEDVIEEHASMLGISHSSTLAMYRHQGSLLARAKYRPPANIMEEIVLARDLAERDDDCGSAIGAMIAAAFGDGMQNNHTDEVTVALYDEAAKHVNLDGLLAEMYREMLIAGQVNTVGLFTQESFSFQPKGSDRQRTRSLVAPLAGVLPSEEMRVIGNDLVGTGVLAFRPSSGSLESWLREFFDGSTSAARKAEMRRQDPVLTTMLTAQLAEEDIDAHNYLTDNPDPAIYGTMFALNPRMVHRTTFPKGSWRYPRPLMTRNFALLEAKRLLNLMDYALLQGGANFLIVAKKGTDQRPAQQAEIDNLRNQVRRASRSGVMIGDHRLDIEIITPKLDELLSTEKRRLLGRKMAMALLRVPEIAEASSGGGQAVLADVELLARVITHDRLMLRRHVEGSLYSEVAKRNPAQIPNGPAKLWFPKIILQGSQYFTDLVLKLRDRGDISRKSAIEAGGFSYDAEVEQRRREKSSGDDKVMTPAAVPFSSPNAGPQDNGGGRPPGTSPGNGRNAPASPPARVRPSRVVQRNAGETVRAMFEEELGSFRVGETTYAILEEYADTKQVGRLTAFERRALERLQSEDWPEDSIAEGPLTVVPVNPGYAIDDVRAVRLTTGLSMLVGERAEDSAMVARALVFRAPEFTQSEAEDRAMAWGFDIEPVVDATAVELEEHAATPAVPEIHLHLERGGAVTKTVLRDPKTGAIVGTREELDDGPDA